MCEPKHCVDLFEFARHEKKSLPYEIKKCATEEDHENKAAVLVGPHEWCLPKKYEKECDILYNFEVRQDDIWIVSFPYSGAPLVQEMIWTLTQDCDLEKSRQETLDVRSPFFEASIFVEDEIVSHIHKESNSPQECLNLLRKYTIPRWQVLRDTTKRRIIKTHLPFSLLPHSLMKVACKIVYVARNPKDVIASAYLNGNDHLNESYQSFLYKFQGNKKYCCPYWPHVLQGWNNQYLDNYLFLWSEDVVKNGLDALRKVSNFLGTTVSEERLGKLAEHLQIESFKTKARFNEAVLRNFLSCHDEFTRSFVMISDEEYVNEKVENWIKENLKITTLQLPD